MPHGILVPRPGIEPTLPALGALSLNHWTTREDPFYISYSNITDYTEVLLLKMSQQPTQGGFKGGQRKDSARKNVCGLILGGWPDFAFFDPRVLTAPGTGTEECSSRSTAKCRVRPPSGALSLPEWAWEREADKGTYLSGKCLHSPQALS